MEVYLTSPWIPAEWVRAHGLPARGLGAADWFRTAGFPIGGSLAVHPDVVGKTWGHPLGGRPAGWETRETADWEVCGTKSPGTSPRGARALSAGVCVWAEEAVRLAEARPGSAVIFSTACDQMRRAFDTVGLDGPRHTFLFNLPSTWQTPAAGEIFRAELERLGRFLLSIGGHAPTAEGLRRGLWQANTARASLLAAAPVSSPRGWAAAVARFHWDGTVSPAPSAVPAPPTPLALVGGPFLPLHWEVLDELEAAGGGVVLNATETGERSLAPVFELESGAGDLMDALIHGYADNLADVFQRPNTRLYAWLKPRLASRGVRGLVLWHYTGCDLWRAEAQTLRETFGLPVLLLEAGEGPGVAPRERTRLQAFMEALK